MAKRILIKTIVDSERFSWSTLPEQGEEGPTEQGEGRLDELANLPAFAEAKCVFLLPAVDVMVKQLSFAASERRHLQKTVPYMLEEFIASDVDRLHIVMGKPEHDSLTVVAVDERLLTEWLQRFDEAGLNLEFCVPEQFVLLPAEQAWTMYYSGRRYLLRDGHQHVFAIEADNIGLALALATDQFAELPSAISLLVDDERDAEQAKASLPGPLAALVNSQVLQLDKLARSNSNAMKSWNLLRGRFARLEQWTALWRQWRVALVMLGAALLVHTGVSFANYQQLSKENLRLRQSIEALHREVFPRGQIVDPRKQMENELARLRGSGSSASFINRMGEIAPILAGAEGLEVNSITFDDKNGDYRFDLVVKSFQDVEKIKQGLSELGLQTELLNSNAQGDKVRARLVAE